MPDSSSYGIFLSYRREDATPYARLLQSELTARFPDAPVFMDLDSIEPGLDFVEVIERAVGSCAVLVVLIGRQWATLAGEGGQRRLDDPDDFVRSEVQIALERGVRVIPVLVDGARPVRRQELPDELQKLARLNALELSSGRYRYDADQLFNVIQRVLAEVKERAEAERQAGEEAQRVEAERKAREEAQRVEAERKAREEAQRVEAERKAARLALEPLTDDDSRTAAAAAAEILGSDKPPSTPPRLELSATAVDFGRIAYRAQSPERKVRLRNAGGGSLNARAASEAKWLKVSLEDDQLALTVDTTRVGRHEYILAVDSDGGSGSVRVQAFVEPAKQPTPVPVTTPPEPSPPGQAVPGAQQRTGASGGSPAPQVTAPKPPPPSAPPTVGGGAGSGSWSARRRVWIAIAAASAVAAAGVISYLLLAGGHKTLVAGGHKTPSPTPPARILPPPCTKKSAAAKMLPDVPSRLVTIGGQPYDALVSGGFGFVTYKTGGLAVMDTAKFAPQVIYRIPRSSLPTANGEALTPDHKHLVVSSGNGAVVYSVSALEHQLPAFVGRLSSPGGRHGVGVALSRDGRFAFVTLQHSGQVAVFNLQQALTRGFGPSNLVRTISVGSNPIGIARSRDGRYMYVAQGLSDTVASPGTLVILDMAKAEKKSGQPIVQTVDAGCGPDRVMPSADGQYVWLTAARGNALLAYSAAKLISDPTHALIARVAVGQAPLGMMTVNNGKQIVVADSNRFNVRGAVSNLAVVDVAKALARQPALVGLIKSGTTPRQFALEPDGTTLLVTNTDSGQVQAVDISHLP